MAPEKHPSEYTREALSLWFDAVRGCPHYVKRAMLDFSIFALSDTDWLGGINIDLDTEPGADGFYIRPDQTSFPSFLVKYACA